MTEAHRQVKEGMSGGASWVGARRQIEPGRPTEEHDDTHPLGVNPD